jgi:hypothetical protein
VLSVVAVVVLAKMHQVVLTIDTPAFRVARVAAVQGKTLRA